MTERSKGQKCLESGCITLLGLYSGSMYCRQHTPKDEEELWVKARDGTIDLGSLRAARAVTDSMGGD